MLLIAPLWNWNKLLTESQFKQQTVQKQLAKDRKAELEALAIMESKWIGTQDKLVAQNKLLHLERNKLIETDKDYDKKLSEIVFLSLDV